MKMGMIFLKIDKFFLPDDAGCGILALHKIAFFCMIFGNDGKTGNLDRILRV